MLGLFSCVIQRTGVSAEVPKAMPNAAPRLMPTPVGASKRAEVEPGDPRENYLREVGIGADENSLARFWDECAATDFEWHKAKQVIGRFGDKEFAIRRKAVAEFLELGPAAILVAAEAENDKDPEVARQATACLKTLIGKHRKDPGWPWEIWRSPERRVALRLAAERDSPLLVPAFRIVLLSPEPDEALSVREMAETMLSESIRPLYVDIGCQVRPKDMQAVRQRSRAILHAVRAATDSQDETVKAVAKTALERLGLREANERLTELKRAQESKARAKAVSGLCQGSVAWHVVPALLGGCPRISG